MIELLQNIQDKFNIDINQLHKHYPKVKDRIIPLSATNISPRTFFHWKKIGLIDYHTDEERHSWVKLNLFEYVWLCACVQLRDFGVPLKIIVKIKETLFKDFSQELINNKQAFIDSMKDSIKFKEDLPFLNTVIELLENNYKNFPEEYKIFTSTIGTYLGVILLNQKEVCLIIHKEKEGFEFSLISYKTMDDFFICTREHLYRPLIMIPLRTIVSDFLTESKNDNYINSFELLTMDERKVLEAVQNRDFKKLEIKLSKNNAQLKILKTTDSEINGAKVNEIKKLIGLKDYETIKLIDRKNKQIYVERNTEL